MTARSIAYWITTALFVLALGGSALADLVLAPPIVEGFATLGYPTYLAIILGVWKALGVLAIAAPGLPRLKEWAYAGFFFHLTGAIASHLAIGDLAIAPLVVLLLLWGTSWALRPQSRVLGRLFPERTPQVTGALATS